MHNNDEFQRETTHTENHSMNLIDLFILIKIYSFKINETEKKLQLFYGFSFI